MVGPAMRAAGCAALADIEQLSVMGVVEVLRSFARLRALRDRLGARIAALRPHVFVGIDVPDFNFGLARALKRQGIPTVHWVCPQTWAWRARRARTLSQCVDHLLALLPFEAEFFTAYGVTCTYVGHPLADMIPPTPARASARRELCLPDSLPVIAVLPGSRDQEIARVAPTFAAACRALRAARPDLRFIACLARPAQREMLATIWTRQAPGIELAIVDTPARTVLTAADLALVASGTVTLEALLCRTPMVVGYRMAALSYFIIRRMITIPRVALPNILAGRAVVPELLQDALTPEAVCREALAWLDDPDRRVIFAEFAAHVHAQLRRDAAAQAAAIVLQSCRE
jgi:lipid-A-disaccharide synthase